MLLTNTQLNHLKKKLLNRYQTLQERLEAQDHFGLEHSQGHESTGELSHYDNHPGDMGTEEFERGKDIALNKHVEQELVDIEAALHMMETGKYGRCQECGQAIAYERLQALPTALYCLEHSDNQIVSKSRSVEEEVLTPPFGKYDLVERDATFYDAEDAWQEVAFYGTSDSPSDMEESETDYDQLYAEAEENVGYVEDVEGFLISDMEGRFIGVNEAHEAYEEDLEGNE